MFMIYYVKLKYFSSNCFPITSNIYIYYIGDVYNIIIIKCYIYLFYTDLKQEKPIFVVFKIHLFYYEALMNSL